MQASKEHKEILQTKENRIILLEEKLLKLEDQQLESKLMIERFESEISQREFVLDNLTEKNKYSQILLGKLTYFHSFFENLLN
jgi:FAD synthase